MQYGVAPSCWMLKEANKEADFGQTAVFVTQSWKNYGH
jgi:hypothetical protein